LFPLFLCVLICTLTCSHRHVKVVTSTAAHFSISKTITEYNY
jgi:hypothetical protein